MAWQNELTVIVRHIIDDLDSSAYTFADSRIEESILVAAQLIHNELEFNVQYTIEVDNGILTPDPTTVAPKDDDFIALCCFRSAIMLMTSLVKTYALKSINIKDGPSWLDTRDIVKNLKLLLDDINSKYDNMKLAYQAGKLGYGKAILSPYAPASAIFTTNYSEDFRGGYYF